MDNFREGKLTPCCQLLAEVSGKKKKIPTMKHQVKLEGAKYPNDVFLISLPAGGSYVHPSTISMFTDLILNFVQILILEVGHQHLET